MVGHVAVRQLSDTSGIATGHVRYSRSVRPVQCPVLRPVDPKTPSEGVTASLAHGAINRSGLRPWLELSTLGDFVSMLKSA